MRLERTRNPRRPAIERIARLVIAWSVTAAIVVLCMTACAEGTSRDAEEGKQQDAERTSVVSDLQATQSILLLTESPEATPPPTAPDNSPGN